MLEGSTDTVQLKDSLTRLYGYITITVVLEITDYPPFGIVKVVAGLHGIHFIATF
jgi:hypothetical protein